MLRSTELNAKLDNGEFSIVCGVKNRIEPLRYTIPTFLQQVMVRQIVLVDWSSSTPLIESLAELDIPGWPDPRVVILRVQDQPHWSLARSINVAMRLVNQPVTLKVDADILILNNIKPKTSLAGKLFFAGDWKKESGNQIHLNGTTMFGTQDFRNVGGYDERIDSYGWEDDDLYQRLEAQGLKRRDWNHLDFFHLPHSDAKRMAHQMKRNCYPTDPTKSALLNQNISQLRSPWRQDSPQSNYQILSIDQEKKHIVVQQQTD